MLSKSEILMSLNNKQKPLCQMATTEFWGDKEEWRSKGGLWGPRAPAAVR